MRVLSCNLLQAFYPKFENEGQGDTARMAAQIVREASEVSIMKRGKEQEREMRKRGIKEGREERRKGEEKEEGR